MLLAVRTLFFLVLVTGCGRTGFDGDLRFDEPGRPGGSGGDVDVPGSDIDTPGGDSTPAFCGNLGRFGARSVVASLQTSTQLTMTLSQNGRYVTSGASTSPAGVTASAIAYNAATDAWSQLDSLTFSNGVMQNGSIATGSGMLFYTTSFGGPGKLFQWYVRRQIGSANWTTVDSSGDDARSVDIETPSPTTIVHTLEADGVQLIRRSTDGGDTWAQVDGPNANIQPFSLANVRIGTLMMGKLSPTMGNGSAWIVRYTGDALANVWQELGIWYGTNGNNTAATVAFFLPNVDGTFIAGSVDDGAGQALGRIAHFDGDGNMTIVDELAVAGSFVQPARRTLTHSAGCTLVFETVVSTASTTTRIRGSSDGVTWVDLTPEANDVPLTSAAELPNGDLLANTGSGLVRYSATHH